MGVLKKLGWERITLIRRKHETHPILPAAAHFFTEHVRIRRPTA
jgi:hypothetical protein